MSVIFDGLQQQAANGGSEIEKKKMQILMKMKESKMYWKLKQDLLKDIELKGSNDSLTINRIQQHAVSTGVEEQLRQLIINCANKSLRKDPIRSDNLDFINQARIKWTEIVLKHYDYTADKLKQSKSPINGGNENDKSNLLFIYDENNLFNFLIGISNSSAVTLNIAPNTLMKVNFITPALMDLRQKYQHLLSADNVENKNSNEYKLREKRGRLFVENEAMESEIEQLAQGGLPAGDRVELYMKYFGIESSSYKHFAKLEEEVDKKELMFDDLLSQDSEEVADNDQYFIFQEIVERITQAFMRDAEVKNRLKIHAISSEKLSAQDMQKIPPCYVLPMKFFSMLVAPLGFCSNKVDITYMLFKEFYCNFFCYLHSISSVPNGILHLSCLFEDLMSTSCSKVMSHLASINVEPIRIAFPWIYFCFIGYTTVENLFLLFDRIIGYRSTEILSIFAVGVFILNQAEILKCRNAADLDAFFSQPIQHSFLSCVRAVIT